jgi:hypothetical protein
VQRWLLLQRNTWEVAVVVLFDLNLNVFKWDNCWFLICFLGLCENIRNGYLYVMTQHLLILKGIYGFKFPKRFLEISSRDLTSSLLFSFVNPNHLKT